MTNCKQHQWKLWIPPEIYKCVKCELFKIKIKIKEQT